MRMIYNGKESTCEQLLKKGSSIFIHTRNLRSLMVEIFKAVMVLNRQLSMIYSL